jgi:quercetin dioxygenase-like cupin family protein
MTTAAEHFSSGGGGQPAAAGRYVSVAGITPVELVPGLEFRPVLGEDTMVNFVRFGPHTEAPHHAHHEEQIVIVLEGEFEFELDGDVRTVRPGEVVVVPSWVPHGAHTDDTSCLEVDVFNPPRQTLLEHARAEHARAEHARAEHARSEREGAGTGPASGAGV